MLEYKLALCGIRFVKQNEAYSSQCAPTSKEVGKQYANKYRRCKRGLYNDAGIINKQDAVGAYNILRLYLQSIKKEAPVFRDLSTVKEVTV